MDTGKPENMHRLFAEAFNAGDLAALVALYEPQARLVPQPGQVITGHQAIGGGLQSYLALRGTIKMETTYVVEAGDVALLRGRWRIAATGPDGNPLEMQGSNVEVVRRQADGRWLFVIDHPTGAD